MRIEPKIGGVSPYPKLRPHHVCCLRFFEGKGYSPAFTENAAAVLQSLKKENTFTVAAGADDLCRACPFSGADCAYREKVNRYDTLAAEALGLAPGGVYEIGPLWEKVDASLVRRLCADCEWAYICANERNETI